MNGTPKIILAPQDGVEQLQPQIDALLEALGHPEALVTDESTFYDFLGFGQLRSRAQAELDSLMTLAGIPCMPDLNDTLVDTARRILKDNPHWPGPRSIQ